LNRFLQVALIAILIRAVDSHWSLVSSFVAQAVILIGASAGDLVPGQIGALEGALSFFAGAIGTTRRNAVAVALLIHLVQWVWVVVGFVTLAFGRAKGRRYPQSTRHRRLIQQCSQ
jgi:uncharacterized membrane protein YbhN (UPF0104 family)